MGLHGALSASPFLVQLRPAFRSSRCRGQARRLTPTLSYKTDNHAPSLFRQQQRPEAEQEQQPEEVSDVTRQQLVGLSASPEELQRTVHELQAENEELQAEIQHLAATLKAALASAPEPQQQQQQQQPYQQQQQHLHQMHSAVGPNGSTFESWEGSTLDFAGASILSSADIVTGVAPPQYHQPTSVSQATLSCSMQHPGSICCSKLSSTLDPGGAACTISLHTTARCTADDITVHRHLTPHELRALAGHALVSAAHSFSQAATAEYRATSGPPQDVATVHDDLIRVLDSGVVICAERTPPSQFGHKSFLLTLQDPQTALRVRAIYKPRVYGDACGWHRTPMEWVAYRLNRLLGMDYVPPTAYRTAPLTLNVGGEEEEESVFSEGAMMLWVENSQLLKEYPQHEWGMDPEVLLSDTRILDVLLHNSDRHHGHFLLGQHWAQGRWEDGRWDDVRRPILIDHAAAFRKEAVVSMEHENAFGSGAVRCVSANTYLRLRFLDAHTIAHELGQHLSRSEQRQLLHRRDYVLHYFDDLVGSQGYAGTVREWA